MVPPTRKFNPGFLNDDELVASYCVRTTEFELLVEVLRECTGHSNAHQIVIGPRGSGKTSLLLRVAAEARRDKVLSTRCFPVTFAEESYEVGSAGEFWLECLANLAAQAPRGDDAPDLDRSVEELRAIRDDQMLSERCLGALLDFADREGKRLVLLVENLNMLFGDMADPDAGWRLRKVLQTEPRIIVFASATSRFDEIDNPDRALYDLFRVRTLRPLDTNQCTVLWEAVSGRRPAQETVRSLEILTGGSPRLIAIVAGFGAALSFRDLMADLFDLVDDHTEYFKGHLESLPAQERRVYLVLAALWKPATTREIADHARLETSTCSAQLARLGERGVVQVAGGSARRKQYYLTERLYNIYYLLRRRRGPDRFVEALIHFMEACYSSSELKEIKARMARDRDGLDAEMRSLHRITLTYLMKLPSLAEHREMLTEVDRAEPSQGGTGESAASVAREFFKNALNVRNGSEDAVAAYEEVILRFGESETPAVLDWVAKALVNKGVALGTLSRPQEALETFDEVVLRFGESDIQTFRESVASALLNRAKPLDALNRLHDVLETCDEVVRRFGESDMPPLLERVAIALVNKGNGLDALNRPQDALESYDEVTRRFGESEVPALLEQVAKALVNKGATLGVLNRPQDALETCDEVVRRFGTSDLPELLEPVATALVNRGRALGALNRWQDALEACDEVVRRFGKSSSPRLLRSVATALVNRGDAWGALNQPQEVLEACEKVIRRFGESETPAVLERVAQALVNKGAALSALNRPQEALEVCAQVVRRFGESEFPGFREWIAKALLNRAGVLNALNRPHEELEACDEVVRRFGKGESENLALLESVASALANKGAVLHALNRPQEALEVFDEVVRRFGESDAPALLRSVATALVNRAGALDVLNRPQEALVACDEVVRRFGENENPAVQERVAIALANKAFVLGALSRTQDALDAYDEVVRRFGDSEVPALHVGVGGALLGTADVEIKSRRYEKAVETATRAIERQKGVPAQRFQGHALRAKAILAGGGDRFASEPDVEAVLALLPELGRIPREAIMALLEFCVALGPQRMRELIQASPSPHLLVPLTTALERELGLQLPVAREVDEVAQDVQRTLAGLKANRTRQVDKRDD